MKIGRPVTSEPQISICAYCGKPFEFISKSSRPVRKYCSHECTHKAQSNHIEKVCPVCGITYTIPKGYDNRYKVCSRKCRLSRTVYRQCLRCGKTFTVHNPSRGYGGKYCSEECYRPPLIQTCKTCGKEFRKQPSSTALYCSISCYRSFTGESSIEKIIREYLLYLNVAFIQEYKQGRYSIDFYLPQFNLAIECDGTYWHRNPKRDKAKNQYLKRHSIGLMRLTEKQIKDKTAFDIINSIINNKPMLLIQ